MQKERIMVHMRATDTFTFGKEFMRHGSGLTGRREPIVVASEPRSEPAVPRPPPLRSILVPVDGTGTAEHALPFALSLARWSGAEVTLATVYSTPQAANDPERLGWRGGDFLIEPLREYLDDLTRRVEETHPVRVRSVVMREFWPEDAICDFGDWQADLVVVAARRRGWWSRFWRGSVSTGVARRTQAPVLVVPAGDSRPDLSAEPALGRVLVPLDGTRRAERVLGPATALTSLFDGECDLLRVIRSRPYSVNWSLAFGGPSVEPLSNRSAEARRYLSGITERLRSVSVSARSQVVTDERPIAEAIARHAKRSGADVIAMTSRGGVGLAKLFRGDLALRVSRLATVPVLICRTA
jgi:nucleotide-binding universal stress UspA family protein